jgi:alpha-N-arabinofuranosidase
MTCPTLPLKPFPKKPARDEFDRPKLGLEWNFIQAPSDFYEISSGTLRITGLPQRIGENGPAAFVGRRLQHHDFTASTTIHFDPKNDNEEAGMTLLNNDQHFDILITRSGNKRTLHVQLEFGSIVYKSKETTLEPGPVNLRIKGDRARFIFSYSQGAEFRDVESVEAKYLSTETVGWFTGVYVGLYATGNGKKCEEPATFDYFEYTGS